MPGDNIGNQMREQGCDTIDYVNECRKLREENDKLRVELDRRNQQTCCTMDYESAYRELQERYKNINDENEKLKQALINLALKLH